MKPILFHDRLSLGAVNRTKDGYLTAVVKAARSGVQLYKGADLGMPETEVVRVWRPPEEVFDAASMRSYAYRPVIIDHPPNGADVTAENWRDLAHGMTGGDVVRDGDFVRVPLALMDASAIKTVENGKREVSMGYSAVVEFVDGVSPIGEPYDAIQRELRMNHLAIVDAARGGSELRIGDNEEEPPMANRTILVDGLSVETTDQGAQAIEKLLRDIATVKSEVTTRDATITQLRKDVETKTGEAAILQKKIDDSALTPAKLDAAVVARTSLIADAKKIAGDGIAVAGKTDIEIRRAAIATQLGDEAAKTLSDEAITGAFALAAKQADGSSHQPNNGGVQPLRNALSQPQRVQDAEAAADKSWSDYVTSLQDGYKNPKQQEATH